MSVKIADKKRLAGLEMGPKVQAALEEYSQLLRSKKLELLEKYILNGLKMFLHKKDFIEKISIDKETFEVKLFYKNGNPIPKELLSKGEQQMFATAVLWALAKTSGKPLPFIIDTPLARLDIEHRSNLVEKFFPVASHQVIIFSTDSEIGASDYQKLLPSISRTYAMEYISEKGKTVKHDDQYFWNEKGDKVIAA